MTDLGKLRTFLTLNIERDWSQQTLTIDQGRYIERILLCRGMQVSRSRLTLLDPNTCLQKCTKSQNHTTLPNTQKISLEMYQSVVGSLMYAMLGTRSDIVYSVGLVSQFSHALESNHCIAVKRIFCYLQGTHNYNLLYGKNNNSRAYSEGDWGSGHDRKSVGGFVFLLNGGTMSWTSKKQWSISLSTTEAEYRAMIQATKEIIWLQIVLDEIRAFKHLEEMSQLHADNQGAIAIA